MQLQKNLKEAKEAMAKMKSESEIAAVASRASEKKRGAKVIEGGNLWLKDQGEDSGNKNGKSRGSRNRNKQK